MKNNEKIKIFGLPEDKVEVASVSKAIGFVRAVNVEKEFRLREVYAYPNPAKGGKCPIIHIEVGLADSVEIKIYDISGEYLHSQVISGDNFQIIDGKYCYEYEWDISGISSGIYIYTIKAKKSGYSNIKVISLFVRYRVPARKLFIGFVSFSSIPFSSR